MLQPYLSLEFQHLLMQQKLQKVQRI